MAAERRLRLLHPRAHETMVDEAHPNRMVRTGHVALPAVLTWLNGEPITDVVLTPWEATDLAGELLLAAKQARQHPTRSLPG